MNPAMLPIITHIMERFGADAFTNMSRANAMLLDLAPGMNRERILVRNFIEMGGWAALRQAQGDYPLIKHNLVRNLTDTFCLEEAAAQWVTRLFGLALGYESGALTEAAPAPVVSGQPRGWVAIGRAHAAAAAADGTVFAGGDNTQYQCDVKGWRSVVAVAAGDAHTVGLKADGTLLAAGANAYDQCDVADKTDVAAVYAFAHETVCVHADGTVTAAGRSAFADLTAFTDIRYIARYPEGLLGVREDGRVVASGEADEDIRWALAQEDAAQVISTFVNGSIVLKKDGRIYKSHKPANYFSPWRDITAIVDLSDSFAVLRADGTVRVLPYERERTRPPCEAEDWTDIVALYGRYKRLIGLTADGRLRLACTDPEWRKRNGAMDFVTGWYPVGSR